MLKKIKIKQRTYFEISAKRYFFIANTNSYSFFSCPNFVHLFDAHIVTVKLHFVSEMFDCIAIRILRNSLL